MEAKRTNSVHLDGLLEHQEDLEPTLSSLKLQPSTTAIHADGHLNHSTDVAPPVHVSTIFRYTSDPDALITAAGAEPSSHSETHVYSRESAPSSTRLESLLTSLLHAPSLTYTSGLSALHALYIQLRPAKIFIPLNRPGEGYHGSAAVIQLHQKLTGCEILDLDDETALEKKLGKGDVLHVETPINPTGESRNISDYAEKAHAKEAFMVVDSTFAPPPLQDPFQHGADIVMHSGTKYFGGHSDMLCGVLATKNSTWYSGLKAERAVLGSVMGSLEGWLGVRSMRTLELRVRRQSENAAKLVAWLNGCLGSSGHEFNDPPSGPSKNDKETDEYYIRCVISRLKHSSLPPVQPYLSQQMPGGHSPVFAFYTHDPSLARRLPSKLHLFTHSTSLGGVESLIEWRVMSDERVDARLMRISCGVEAWEDLKADLVQGCKALVGEEEEKARLGKGGEIGNGGIKGEEKGEAEGNGGEVGEKGFGEAMMG